MQLRINQYSDQANAGFGLVAKELANSLHDFVDLTSFGPNVLNWCQPQDYIYSTKTIGYTPWESTELRPEWKENIAKLNDLWTTAEWLVPIFEQACAFKPFVLGHGIEPSWEPIRHRPSEDKPFTFLHVGGDALRKGGDIVLEAWSKAFAKRTDMRLIMKTNSPVVFGDIKPHSFDNVQLISKVMHEAELWKLYALADCMVYPTRGEGFGLIPFQAMATGLPTILPNKHMGDFTLYSRLLLCNAKLVDSEQPFLHPGKWLEHDIDELICHMQEVVVYYPEYSLLAYNAAKDIHKKYTWQSIGLQAYDRLRHIM